MHYSVRPLRCQAFCFPCCLQELEIQSPPGQVMMTMILMMIMMMIMMVR